MIIHGGSGPCQCQAFNRNRVEDRKCEGCVTCITSCLPVNHLLGYVFHSGVCPPWGKDSADSSMVWLPMVLSIFMGHIRKAPGGSRTARTDRDIHDMWACSGWVTTVWNEQSCPQTKQENSSENRWEQTSVVLGGVSQGDGKC